MRAGLIADKLLSVRNREMHFNAIGSILVAESMFDRNSAIPKPYPGCWVQPNIIVIFSTRRRFISISPLNRFTIITLNNFVYDGKTHKNFSSFVNCSQFAFYCYLDL